MSNPPSRLQQELKQNRPFRSLGQEATVSLLRTGDLLRRRMSTVLESEDVTLQQYNVLRILRGAGPEGLPTLEIADRMIEQTPGITRLLDRLEAKRLVGRERCPADRRQVTCRIAKDGLALLARLDPVVNEADDTLLGPLTQTELRQLIRLLDRVREGPAR
ncbi:MAG: MarR family transcriptional regulator [Gemmatimonadetes bacterium]|jgi:DNA-binding MarR family transcriptional regulator|nr:MarR family transcriptional regulator [Gemmatimonadota bacterium]